jgi:uncharacterized membrane protein YraQ (UPF0718 family)
VSAFFVGWVDATWNMMVESAAFFFLGLVLAGLVKALIDDERIRRFLGRNPRHTVIRAALIGVPLPLCSCSVLPVAMQLRKSGVSRGGTVSFLVSTPESGIDSILLTYSMMDPLMTVARPLAAFLSAVAAGTSEDILGKEDQPLVLTQDYDGCDGHCDCASTASVGRHPSLVSRIGEGLRHAFTEIMSDLAPYLLVGYALAGLVAVFFGPDANGLPAALQHGWMAYAGALVVGVPLYICATSSTPLAAVLLASGFPPGAILVFLLVGPATNLASLTVLRKILGIPATLRYLVAIVVMSILCGFALDFAYWALAVTPNYRLGTDSEGGAYLAFVCFAVLLSAMILWHTGRSLIGRLSQPARTAGDR